MSDGNIKFLKSWSMYWLLLLKIFQEANLGDAWKQNEGKEVIEVYYMWGRVSYTSHTMQVACGGD